MHVPAIVRQAIENFQCPSSFNLAPATERERSIIFDYGVRVSKELEGKLFYMWVCLASENCRSELIPRSLSNGKTSSATRHLKQVHGLSSEKTIVEESRKRSRDEEINKLINSDMYKESPDRLNVLLETQRIINNNLPFKFGEYEESHIIRGVCSKEQLSTPVNSKMVRHTIVEMYTSAKLEIMAKFDDSRIGCIPYFTIITDFWTSKITNLKYLGVRISFVDNNWTLQSILLGIRQFNPTLSQREHGIREPYLQWISKLLDDFNIKKSEIFASTTDAGSDVKWMMTNGLKLKWQWCIPHLINAATKRACGIVTNRNQSFNIEMTDLIAKIRDTIRQVKTVEVLGEHFKELCRALSDDNTTTILLDFQSHRFMGITKVIKRLNERWDVLIRWYATRIQHARMANKEPPKYPLSGHKEDLLQLYSLFQPITVITQAAQSERPNQVDVLVLMINLRLTTLNSDKPLKIEGVNSNESAAYYETLTPLVEKTRALLSVALFRNFYKRYEDPTIIRQTSYVLEAQMLLHPSYKNFEQALKKIVYECNKHKGVSANRVSQQLFDQIKTAATVIIQTILTSLNTTHDDVESKEFSGTEDDDSNPYNAILLSNFGPNDVESGTIQNELHRSRIQEELDRWIMQTPELLGRDENGHKETVLTFWRRQYNSSNYVYLPQVAKIIFSMPTSSASIERDFGISGNMVASQRSSLKPENVEMAMFLNRNKRFLDITQVIRLRPEEIASKIPQHMVTSIQDQEEKEWEEVMDNCFSSQASLYDDVAGNGQM